MIKQIYIYLIDEGVDAWRPVEAEYIKERIFKIISKMDPTEIWQFLPESIVRCEEKVMSNGEKCLVAVEQITTN